MLNQSQIKEGSIVLVKFPFTNLEQSKKRPALVLKVVSFSKKLKIIQIAMITSQIDSPEIEGDSLIKSWKESGLLHPSRVRLSKVASVDGELIDSVLGKMADKDKSQLSKNFKTHFDFWV